MKNSTQRRGFLRNALWATGGLVLLGTKRGLAHSKSPDSLVDTSECDLRTSLFKKQIEISGQLYDTSGKKTVANAEIEFWHLSPNSKVFGHRGKLKTDENGRYRLLSDFPSKAIGKSRTIHFKITQNNTQYQTELKLSDFGANITGKHWEQNHQLGNDLLFPKFEKSLFRTKINFNFSFNTK